MVIFLIWKLCLPTFFQYKNGYLRTHLSRLETRVLKLPAIISRSFLFYSYLDLTRCIALLSIPFSLKKNPINYFEVPVHIVSGNTNQPRIKCDIEKEADFREIANKSTLFEIKVEQFTTGTTRDFVTSVALLSSSFYVLNVEYLSNIENTLTFIQKFFLDINDKSKTSNKVLKFMSVLKKKLNAF